MKINQKHTAFSRNEHVEIRDDYITRSNKNGETVRIPFREVSSIQLIFEGYSQAHQKNVYRCLVKGAGKKLLFSNAIFGGKEKASMDKKYRQMVAALHKEVTTSNPNAKLTQGSNLYYLCGWFCLVMGIILLLALPLATLVGGGAFLLRKAWVIGMMPVMLSGVAWPLIKRGGRNTYSADQIPVEYLPNPL